MPRRRLAFAVRVGLPRATMNAPWRRLLPGLGGAAVMMGPAPRFQPGREAPDDPCRPFRRARHDPARLTGAERPPTAGFLAGYCGLTREAYALDLRQRPELIRLRPAVAVHGC
jgi:hypothetical protein